MPPSFIVPQRLVKTGGKLRKGFTTAKQGPYPWKGHVDYTVRSPGVTLGKRYVPCHNKMPLLMVPDLSDCKLKPYLSPHCETVQNYATSHHDVMVVMQAEGYVPSQQRPQVPAVDAKAGQMGFPKAKPLDQQVDEAMKNIPQSLQTYLEKLAGDDPLTFRNPSKPDNRRRKKM